MVIKFATFDPAQNPNDFNPAFPPTPPSSPSATLCQPCEYTCTFTRAIVGRLVAASASLVLTPQAFEIDGHEIEDQSAETPLHSISSVVHPEFHQRQLKEFNLKELEVATQNFSNLNILGRGGFGNVYKGRLADGSTVAIKRCKAEKTQVCIAQFETEVMVGSIIPPHCNLLTMLGFCRTSKCRELLLVSPFRSNGSVSFRLRHRPKNQSPLDWPTRMKIATGAARGLSHLHDLNILHRDIKAANILLDEEFEPHIGDFGLAKFIDRSHGGYSVDCIKGAPVLLRKESKAGSDSGILHVTTAERGTIGHIAPEYLSTGKCSVKTDVFAFGTMLLELVTGERALDLARRADDNHLTLLDWVEGLLIERRWGILVDPDLQGACNEEEIEKVIQLALLCTQSDPRGRPSAAQVVRILEGQSIEKRWREYRRWQEYLNDSRPLRSNDWIVELQLFNSFFWKKSSGPDDQDYLKKHSTDFSQPCWDCRHLN